MSFEEGEEYIQTMSKRKPSLISMHGEFWQRDRMNFRRLKEKYGDPKGVYALYNGLTPVYFGQGTVSSRLRDHDKSGFRNGYWDHFSWYKVENKRILKDLETLLLRILPVYLHMLNRQRGFFVGSQKAKPWKKHVCELKRPKYGAGAKHRRRSKKRR